MERTNKNSSNGAAQWQPQLDQKYVIGFGKGVRVGNFRLYKLNASVGSKEHVPALVVASLSQAWKVQIPSTLNMYGFIEMLYRTYVDGNEQPINIVLSNLMNATTMPDARYHRLINDLASIWADPNMTIEKDGAKVSVPDAIANDVRWVWEEVLSDYAKQKELDDTEEAQRQLGKDETFHAMVDEMEKSRKEGKKSEKDDALKK